MVRGDGAENVVITGFMSSGKSSVGREVAQRLGRPFVDMDEVIEEREGATIVEIFAQRGEGHFRAMEKDLCHELAANRGLVIATGGGTLVPVENRSLMEEKGWVICLQADVEELLVRLPDDGSRPLLGGDRRTEMETLLAERRQAYAPIATHIDTTGLAVTKIADVIVGLVEEKRDGEGTPRLDQLQVRTPTGPYQVLLGYGLLPHVGSLLAQRGVAGSVALVTNETVGTLHGPTVMASLRRSCLRTHLFTVPDGERHKNLETASSLYRRFLDVGIDRSSTVLALGGGVITDLAGFVAATYMRGLPLVMLPTTLLAVVDASVGGKVGVDLPQGKNLVGAFKQPTCVIADLDTLSTLPAEELCNGYVEMIKAAIIGSPALFERLERGGESKMSQWVKEAMEVKIALVEEDPYEGGGRAKLNLGHTFGHALEKVSGYCLPHGRAVSIGLTMAARLAMNLGLCDAELERRIVACLERFDLPTGYRTYEPLAIWRAMGDDKKRESHKLRLVLPREIGRVSVTDQVSRDDVLRVLEEKRLA
jgi:shikimate kinase/3-dehydroquinate synthase